MRPLQKSSIISSIYNHGFLYPTPSSLSYFWNFGSLAGLALGIQIVTGIALTFWHIGNVDLAFSSVEFLMREVNGGWLIRYLHSNVIRATICKIKNIYVNIINMTSNFGSKVGRHGVKCKKC